MSRAISKLYVPFTEIREATQIFLCHDLCVPEGVDIITVDLTGDLWGYPDLLQRLWNEGDPFMMMEHDIVPWPGALDTLLECDLPWCFFGYLPGINFTENHAANFGLVKFEEEFFALFPDVWREHRRYHESTPGALDPWVDCDTFLVDHVRDSGKYRTDGSFPHQHWPSVLNANPKGMVSETTRDGHEHKYEPSPHATPGYTPANICVYPGCQAVEGIVPSARTPHRPWEDWRHDAAL